MPGWGFTKSNRPGIPWVMDISKDFLRITAGLALIIAACFTVPLLTKAAPEQQAIPRYEVVGAGKTIIKVDKLSGRTWEYKAVTLSTTNGPVSLAGWVELQTLDEARKGALEAIEQANR